MFLYEKQIVQDDMNDIISCSFIPFELLNDKTVLVTGASGMLAYYFTCALMHLNIKKGYNIRVIALARTKEKAERKYSGFLNHRLFKLLIQDICQPIQTDEKVDYILHAAGSASPYFIKNNPVGIIAANTQGTVNVLEFARRSKAENILFTSTREVYGKLEGVSEISEDQMGVLDPLDSRSCYPESKRMAEQLFESYYRQYNIPFTVVRIAHSYGPGMEINKDGRVMSDFIANVVNHENIVLKSSGTAVRAFCYVSDAVSAMFLALLGGAVGEAYNISNETEPAPIREIAEQLVGLFPERNLTVKVEVEVDSNLYCAYKRVGLSNRKIEALGWAPAVDLKRGMYKTVKSFE